MNEPTPLAEDSEAAAIAWPRSLVVPIAITLVLLAFFTTLELPGYVHGRGVPRATVWVVLASYAFAIMAWMRVETSSARFARSSIDRPGAWFRQQLGRLPVFVVIFIALGYGLRLLGFSLLGFEFPGWFPVLLGLLLYEVIKAALLYCCWLGLAFGVLSFVKMRRQAEHLLAAQKSLVEAKLMRLKGQLRPHFLFNTLNTISSLMQVDVARADRMVTQLGDLLRANLDVSDREVVALEQELGLLRQYAGIMQERFIGRVTIDWEIDPKALQASVPTMLLQPLMENAFKHGVERSTAVERLSVRIVRKDGQLVVILFNSGSAFAEGYKDGWGLRNSKERLQLLYGSLASLSLRNENEGATVEMTIPFVAYGDTIDVSKSAFGL